MGLVYRYTIVRGVDPIEVDAMINEIPGVRRRGNIVSVPENAHEIVGPMLRPYAKQYGQGVNYRVYDTSEELPWDDVKPWVRDFALPFQRAGLDFAKNRDGAYLAWAPGAGKTLGGLLWALASPGLVVFITRAIARRTIEQEVLRYTNVVPFTITGLLPPVWVDRTASRLAIVDIQQTLVEEGFLDPVSQRSLGKLTVATRAAMGAYNAVHNVWSIPPDTRVLIIGYETLHAHYKQIAALKPTSVVLDELHRAKAPKRFAAVPTDDPNKPTFQAIENISYCTSVIAKASKRRLGMSGNPVKNRPIDLWAQLDCIEPWQWGTRAQFAARYCDRKRNVYGGIDDRGSSNLDELRARLNTIMHIVPRSVTHGSLPPKRRQLTYIPAEELLAANARAEARELAGRSLLEQRMALASTRKRPQVTDIVKDTVEAGQKIVVMFDRKRDVSAAHKALAKVKCDVWALTGDTSIAVRDAARETYMAHPGPAVILATGDSIGETLSFHDTDRALMASLPYTPAQLEQREGRFTRQGQKRPIIVEYLIAEGTVDEHIAQILLEKLPAVEKLTANEDATSIKETLLGSQDEDAIVDSILAKITKGEADD